MRVALCLLLLFLPVRLWAADSVSVVSPDGATRVVVENKDKLYYAVYYKDKALLLPSAIKLNVANLSPRTHKLTVKKTSVRTQQSTIEPPVPEKRKIIPDVYRELTVRFQQPFSLIVRVYNDGVAWRWQTHFKKSIQIESELAEFNFPELEEVYFSPVKKRDDADIYHTSFEELYQAKPLDSITTEHLIFTPTLVAPEQGPKISITESDLETYPGMFLRGTGKNKLTADFAPYPQEEKITAGEFPQAIVTKRHNFIAQSIGSRFFPWRVLLIAPEDKDLPVNDLVYRLASPSRVKDVSWIQPGKGTDEWIIGINLFNIPFKSGINTATYKYYIDFAKRFGFDRIMMDAGWSDNQDLFKINPNLNMNELTAYARAQGIKICMWTLALTLEKHLEPALYQFNKWGVDFIMTDFIDRDDQKAVDFYHKIAAACANHKIMLMFHGAFKPAGFTRTWPHALTREGVLGSEFNGWSHKPTPEHNVQLPFIRMTAGPMDYEPGLLDNATAKTFRPINEKVMSQGTRCHQLAMFVVYDSPMQFFSGNPSQGLLEPAFMELLGSIPTVWDTTRVLEGKVGDFIITARKKGADWYIGGMTDWTNRQFTVNLDFLPAGTYEATICEDGVNADRYASDYILRTQTVSNTSSLPINMAPGGGYLVRLRKK
ncbi:glycoside hydrolase family 97 protein [Adhaeribacter radiodurans]|uniref:Glycoside hydrolase family 97 protein n=1 Tax=Adhaeribacter radiodurans TaxID=2745197 RepID=A0A7L7LDZ8_9BACT|nr:glycoside hydrolase family 97 protein [Adhaeribacter radiodurans]QMU30765.1 glycoside hydrolase family 97 protein [Adhaeribacter radiodurans]